MKRWPIIRHIRALKCYWDLVWRCVHCWGVRDVDHMEGVPGFDKERAKARAIWSGTE